MRRWLFLVILLLTVSPKLTAQFQKETNPVEIISSGWSKITQKKAQTSDQSITPAQSAIRPGNTTFERSRRVNDPVGKIDTNEFTIEARSAALEKVVQESRSPKLDPTEGFLYQTKIRNTGKSTIEILFWEYKFTERTNQANLVSRQFLCGVNIKSNKEKDISVFSLSAPSNSVSVDSLKSNTEDLFEEQIIINRVEYADGTIWQRKDWNFSAMKPSIDRALKTPWERETCRSL